ncbi:MAG: type II secretion system F family protein [Betaproteobacteria bacterium]|nr:type II secretion system F family protein [Betaproteobacteria bacterium]
MINKSAIVAKFRSPAQGLTWLIREKLYRHLSTQITNGVPIDIALVSFRKRLRRAHQIKACAMIAEVEHRMQDGATMAEALKPWIPLNEYGVVSAGELSGGLPRSLELIIESRRRMTRVYMAFKAALVNPAIYAALTFGMLWAIGKFVTPELENSLPKSKVHGMVYVLYAMGDFVTSWWVLIPLVAGAFVILAFVWSLPQWTGKHRIAAENLFPYAFYRDMHGYLWLMGFAQLLRAGLPDTVILARQKNQGSPWLRERLRAYWFRMENGANLSDALLERGAYGMPAFGFPNPGIVDDIESLAGFPDFPEKVTTLAMQWAHELESTILIVAKSFGRTMEMMMYVWMGFLMMAINELTSQLSALHGG